MAGFNFLNLEFLFFKLLDVLKRVFFFFSTVGPEGIDPADISLWDALARDAEIYLLLIIISLLILVFIIYIIFESNEISKENRKKREEHFIKPPTKTPKNPQWEEVQKLFESTNPADWRLAIIEADSMLDKLLIDMGYSGDTMAERLNNIDTGDFPMLNAAWEAHKVRNRIAHEGMDYIINSRDAHRVYRLYESVFASVNYI